MADIWQEAKRSEVMSLIRSKNTKPERIVRSVLHRRGYRFRLHRRDLPGQPDIVLPRYRTAIFVHGCFWHSHRNCRDGRVPQSNERYWRPKLELNARRDEQTLATLEKGGWNTLVVWECEVERNLPEVVARIEALLGGVRQNADD